MPADTFIMDSALPDNRPQKERDKNYHASEIAAGAPTVPFRNQQIKALTATVYSQEYTSSCVPHDIITQLEYEGIVSPAPGGLSQLNVYRRRYNYPAPGSASFNIYDELRRGQRLNKAIPVHPGMSEWQANELAYDVGVKLIQDFNYFDYFENGKLRLDLMVADIADGKAINIHVFATEEEWSKEYVEIMKPGLSYDEAFVKHGVCLVPKGDFMLNGKRWLTVHDSAAFGGRHLRYIEYDKFVQARVYYAAKVYAKGNIPVPPAPAPVKPLARCQLNDKGQAVRNLQAFLVGEKKLEAQYVTGFYGPITAKAVLWWQLEHWNKFTANVPQLLEWRGEFWGDQSIAIVK
jgi:hypothetical protein